VRPKLQYACSAWDSHHQKDKAALEIVQRKAARFVTGNCDRLASVTEMLQDLKWDTLETMSPANRLTLEHKRARPLHQTSSRRIALLFAARARDSKVSLLAD